MSNVLNNFETWKQFLGNRVAAAKNLGVEQEEISKLAYEIGEFLHDRVDPKNDEQRVLKELWDVGDDNERQTMARMMIKLAQTNS